MKRPRKGKLINFPPPKNPRFPEEITLRDAYAAHAMTGLLLRVGRVWSERDVAEQAFSLADAMIRERSK